MVRHGFFCCRFERSEMMKAVTAIEQQKQNNKRVNVYLDGQFGFGLSISLLNKISIGQVLSDEEIGTLVVLDETSRAKVLVANYLKLRPRSEQEVRRYLVKKEFSEQAISAAIDDFIESDLINDHAFADYWIEQRIAFRPRGRFGLQTELHQKGIDRQIIDEALTKVDYHQAALKAGKKKASQLANTSETEFRNKLGQYLQRRGFDYEVIAEVTKELRESVASDN